MHADVLGQSGSNAAGFLLTAALGLMWLWSGVAKVRTPLGLDRLRIIVPLPDQLLRVSIIVLPWVEIVLGVLLLFRVFVTQTLIVSAVALWSFAALQAWALIRASLLPDPEQLAVTGAVAQCGCFGGGHRAREPLPSKYSEPGALATRSRELDRSALPVVRAFLLGSIALALLA